MEQRREYAASNYFGARYYDSGLGRFLTADAQGGDKYNPQSLNRYAYAWDNPATMTDPTGMYVCADAKQFHGKCGSAQDKAFEAPRRLGQRNTGQRGAVGEC